MADALGIEFPLLEDKEQVLAKAYAGVSADGFSLPAVYVLNQDGTVFFHRKGETKDDRVYTPELLNIVDEMTGDTSLPGAIGYDFDTQIRLGGSSGVQISQGEYTFAADLQLAVLHSIAPVFSLGVEVGSLVTPYRELHVSALFRGRKSYWKGVGELYLQAPIGIARRFSESDKNGLYTGLIIGNEVEYSPQFFLYTDLALLISTYSNAPQGHTTFTRLVFQVGAGWKF